MRSSFARLTALGSLALLLMLAAGAPPAAAQDSNTRGFFFQFAFDSQVVDYDDDAFDGEDTGGGISLRAGYGLSRVVTLFGGIGGAGLDGEDNDVVDDEYGWGSAEIGARFNLRPGRKLVPYADVALRGVVATADEPDFEFEGGALGIGGGVSYFISRAFALDAALRVGGGRLDEVDLGPLSADLDDEIDFTEARLSIGLTFYPTR